MLKEFTSAGISCQYTDVTGEGRKLRRTLWDHCCLDVTGVGCVFAPLCRPSLGAQSLGLAAKLLPHMAQSHT